jgi:hypothetical protein
MTNPGIAAIADYAHLLGRQQPDAGSGNDLILGSGVSRVSKDGPRATQDLMVLKAMHSIVRSSTMRGEIGC